MASHLLCPPPNLQPQHSCLSYMQLCSRFLHQTTPQNLCIHTSNTLVLPSSSKCREHSFPVPIAPFDHKSFCVWHTMLLLDLQGMAMFSLICHSVKHCHGTLWLVFLGFFGVTSSFWLVVAHQVHVLFFTCGGWVASNGHTNNIVWQILCQEINIAMEIMAHQLYSKGFATYIYGFDRLQQGLIVDMGGSIQATLSIFTTHTLEDV